MPIMDQLKSVSPNTAEAFYQQFYPACKASNRRALWLAMKVLNERTPRHKGAVFSALVDELVGVVGQKAYRPLRLACPRVFPPA